MLSFAARGTSRRRATPVAAIVVLAGLLVLPGATSPASAATYVANGGFANDVGGWTVTSNATVKHLRAGSDRAAELTPRATTGTSVVGLQSSVSPSEVTVAGSAVTVATSVRTTQKGRKVGLRVQEMDGSKVVSERTVYVTTASATSWHRLTVNLRTAQAGTRVRVYVNASLTNRNQVRIGTFSARAVAPPMPGVACEDIDYSDPAQGKLTFADDFDGSTLDPEVWRVRDGTYLNHDGAWISRDNVSVHDGVLDIEGRRMDKPVTVANGLKTRWYSTGYVDTMDGGGYGNAAGDRFAQKYGHFEVRALVPSRATMSRGIWPAFWLRADDELGEIDPMESYGAPTIRDFDPSPSYEWNSWADTSQQSTKEHTQGRAHPKLDNEPIWKDWHTYGVNWSPTCLRYLYDGKTVGVVPLSSKPYFTGPTFDDAFHLRLNMQVGSPYWGWADEAHTRPSFNFLIDSVKVYQGNGL
jgi:beta-glucanase (GH16 family)